MKIATEIGHGCRVEGPHGPTKCGEVWHGSAQPIGPPPEPVPEECACGCSAFEDYCVTYLEWSARISHESHGERAPCAFEHCETSPCRDTREAIARIESCVICLGRSGNVIGNSNIIGGKKICDYCHAAMMK